jgi:MEMO1 family protein
MSERKLAVSGQFYPSNKDELLGMINNFDHILKQNDFQIDDTIANQKAIIVPHAGYVYSGFTANIAYKYIPKDIKNIIVIGPSHRYRFDGLSVANCDIYPTPLGYLDINKDISQQLINEYDFINFHDAIHCEHSTETQFPFIKHYCSVVKVVEMVYGNIDYKNISKVIKKLLESPNNLIVISTDLSHFYNLDEANKLDNICLNGIVNQDTNILNSGCEACGILGIKAMIDIASKQNMQTKILDYRTSADFSGDENRVVGYMSGVCYL